MLFCSMFSVTMFSVTHIDTVKTCLQEAACFEAKQDKFLYLGVVTLAI